MLFPYRKVKTEFCKENLNGSLKFLSNYLQYYISEFCIPFHIYSLKPKINRGIITCTIP